MRHAFSTHTSSASFKSASMVRRCAARPPRSVNPIVMRIRAPEGARPRQLSGLQGAGAAAAAPAGQAEGIGAGAEVVLAQGLDWEYLLEAIAWQSREGLGRRGGTGSAIAKEVGEAGAAGAAPR